MTDHLRQRIESAWSLETTFRQDLWTPDNKAIGQCGVTTLYLFDTFGGTIWDAWLEPQGITRYFFNTINGRIVDLTWKQFPNSPKLYRAMPIERGDILANQWFIERYGNFLNNLNEHK